MPNYVLMDTHEFICNSYHIEDNDKFISFEGVMCRRSIPYPSLKAEWDTDCLKSFSVSTFMKKRDGYYRCEAFKFPISRTHDIKIIKVYSNTNEEIDLPWLERPESEEIRHSEEIARIRKLYKEFYNAYQRSVMSIVKKRKLSKGHVFEPTDEEIKDLEVKCYQVYETGMTAVIEGEK